jgi:hypothetical protein
MKLLEIAVIEKPSEHVRRDQFGTELGQLMSGRELL